MEKRNIVNAEAIGPAVDDFMITYKLDGFTLSPSLHAKIVRAVERQEDGWQSVRKRRVTDPEWVATRLEEGVRLHRFVEIDGEIDCQALDLSVHLHAVEALASGSEPDLVSSTARAKRCLARFERHTLASLATEAERIWRGVQTERFTLRYEHEVAPKAELPATDGARWIRLRTLAQLNAIGRRYGNCLARSRGDHHRCHWQRLLDGKREFWALYPKGQGSRSVALATVDPEDDTLDEVEGPGMDGGTRELSCRYRDDVAALMRGRGLDPDWTFPVMDTGLVPEMVAAPVAPSAKGRMKGVPWRVFRFERSLVVERGGDDPACAVIDLEQRDVPKRLEDARTGGTLAKRPLARILARYARRMPVIDPVLGRVLALALREIA